MTDISADEYGNGRTLLWRMREAEKDIEQLYKSKADARDVQRLAEEFAGMKRMLAMFVLALVTATLTFGFWAIQIVTHG